MRQIWILRTVVAGMLVLLMGMIFYLSAEPAEASDQTSGGLITRIIRLIDPAFDRLDPDMQAHKVQRLQNTVRTLAHLSEYTLLGGLAGTLALTFSFRLRWQGLCWLLCSFFALSDEVHQAFVPGRACQITDIIVDASGALFGLLLVFGAVSLGLRILRKRKGVSDG